MLKRLTGVLEYRDFIDEINSDPDFSDPMLGTEEQMKSNLLDVPDRPGYQVFGIYENREMTGLFAFLILEEETYLEMLAGLSRSREAWAEMLSYLKEKYKGYRADFVFNPGNYLLSGLLRDEKAEFDAEQQKMVLERERSHENCRQIELYSPKYREQYIAMHSEEGYWTAEKVIEARDRFRIFLAIENHAAVGYLDITYSYEENEPYDIFVKEEYRGRGYGKAMLARAIELNRPRGMMVLAETENTAAVALYESLGFTRVPDGNSITACLLLS